MANRKQLLVTNEFYHIFNRTVADEPIFNNKHNLNRILALTNFYRFKTSMSFSHFQSQPEDRKRELWKVFSSTFPLVELYCFSFMPNHFHFLLRQTQDTGIDNYISNIQNGFAKFFNTKFDRYGSLFCHSFDRVLIETEEQFIHVTRYIHLNHVTGYLIKLEELDTYPFTSFPVYMKNRKLEFINTDIILKHFKTPKRYREFVYNQSDYQRKLQKIKNLILEDKKRGLKLNNPKG